MYTYDSADKLQYVSSPSGDKSYFYDGDGRTRTISTSAGNTTFSYDYEGHVTGITYPNASTNSFNYNGLGTRVKRTDVASGTRTFLHDGLGPADGVLFDGSVSFTPGISERTSGGSDRWYNADGLGSLTDITDAFGNTTNRTWDAFGNQKTGTNFIYLHGYGESGNYQEDKDSGLKLCGLRYYDSMIGRFLTPDPAGVGDNWYDYCGNNPVDLQDPTGQIADGTCGAVGAYQALNALPWFHVYSSDDAAAAAVTEYIWPLSWREHREYGGWILKRHDGKFVLADLDRAPDDRTYGVAPSRFPPKKFQGWPIFWAYWHTHPFNEGDPYPDHPGETIGNPDDFSDQLGWEGGMIGDIPLYRSNRVNGYLRSPHVLKKWFFRSQQDEIIWRH